MPKKALVTGISGQDGSYLAELLLEKGYEVHGIVRRQSSTFRPRLDAVRSRKDLPQDQLHLHYGDLADGGGLVRLVGRVAPDEVYNLAAQSHVRVSFDTAEYTTDVTATGCIRLLEAIRDVGLQPRFYQASSSEMYGMVREIPQTETTPFYPRSPYACAKVFAYWATVNYRESYGLHASNGILFNHESPRRGETFVTRKITLAAARIKLGLQQRLQLGNLDSRRDWGYAKEYVEVMWRMLQQPAGDDYVVATHESHTIAECLEVAFGAVGLRWQDHVDVDPRFFRPAEVDHLIGNPEKARLQLGWEPRVRFRELIELMMDADLRLIREQRAGNPILSF
jgi:GDPmannose 4,6-dehydratase